MKKLISSSREKRIFVLSCLSIGLFIFYRGIYSPLTKANENLQDKILVLEKQLTKNQHAIAQNAPYSQDYAEAINCYKQSKSDKETLVAIPNELENIAQDKQVEIRTSAALKSKTTATSNHFTINLSLNGKLENILEFIYTLQNCPHLYSISEMTLEKKANTDSKVQCRLLLTKNLIK